MILITGASGTVGREVARALEGRAPLRRGLREPGPDGVAFDFGDSATFGPALEGVDRVFLLRPPQLANARRDFGPFVEAMKAARIGQVVFLSVKGAARNRLLPHHGIERLIEASGLGWTHLRPNDFMQNFATVHRADIRERSEIWAPAGRGRTSFIDVRDIGEAAARVMTEEGHLGRAYTLTGAEALDLRDVATLLSEALGRTIAYRDPGALRFILRKRAEGHPLPFALVMTMVYTVARLGLAAEITPDLERLIGRPPTAFRTFARDYAQTWR
jgi:uncharacterized protein YbjT (DUF2867 family)